MKMKCRHTWLEDMQHQTCEQVNENQPGQQESKHTKIENDSNDDWVWDFDMDKVINTYHTFVKKQRFGNMNFVMMKDKQTKGKTN